MKTYLKPIAILILMISANQAQAVNLLLQCQVTELNQATIKGNVSFDDSQLDSIQNPTTPTLILNTENHMIQIRLGVANGYTASEIQVTDKNGSLILKVPSSFQSPSLELNLEKTSLKMTCGIDA